MASRFSCPVRSITNYNEDTRQVVLELPESVSFKAGQYLEIVLPKKKCPFSIASSPAISGTVELHIRPTPGSEDSVEIEKLLDGNATTIEIEMPKGDCFLERTPDHPLILMAASTGITQMKSIVDFIMPDGINQPIHLYWGVLADKDLYLDELFRGWVDEHELFHYTPVVSEPEGSPDWNGRTGLVGDIVLEDFSKLDDVTVYVSGGPGMVYACLDSFMAKGMTESSMFSDIFSYAPRPKS